jgi:hypothetical protein
MGRAIRNRYLSVVQRRPMRLSALSGPVVEVHCGPETRCQLGHEERSHSTLTGHLFVSTFNITTGNCSPPG